jgi:uncharacterized protein DUF6768
MTEFDEKLKASLSADDEAFLQDLEGDQNVFSQLGSTFHGPMGLMSKVAFLFIAAFTLLMILSGWQAFHAETLRTTVLWSAGFIACLIPHGLLRMWLFDRANHLAVLRELKKIELRIVRLESSH